MRGVLPDDRFKATTNPYLNPALGEPRDMQIWLPSCPWEDAPQLSTSPATASGSASVVPGAQGSAGSRSPSGFQIDHGILRKISPRSEPKMSSCVSVSGAPGLQTNFLRLFHQDLEGREGTRWEGGEGEAFIAVVHRDSANRFLVTKMFLRNIFSSWK